MESFLSFLRTHWDYEPPPHPTFGHPLPPLGEREGVRGFMESEHLQNLDVSWDHEPGLRKSLDCRQPTFRFMGSALFADA